MAKQVGPYPLTGKLSNLSMYKSPFGYLAREKGGSNRSRVLRHPDFINTRRNAAEFKSAVVGGTLLRHSMKIYLRHIANSWLNGRMNGLLLDMVQSDNVSERGERTAALGDVDLLEGFEFNHLSPLGTVLPVYYSTGMDTEKGMMQLKVGSFVPRECMKVIEGATHFKIVSIGVVVNFKGLTWKNSVQDSGLLAVGDEEVGEMRMDHVLEVKKGEAIVLTMGVLFYKMDERGRETVLKGGAMRVLQTGRS